MSEQLRRVFPDLPLNPIAKDSDYSFSEGKIDHEKFRLACESAYNSLDEVAETIRSLWKDSD